jgi:hypothetical protein
MVKKVYVRLVLVLVLGSVAMGLNSCLPLAAGAAAGYVAHDQGYRVQAPLKQTGQ